MVKANKVIFSLFLLLAAGIALSAQQRPDYAWTRFLVDPSCGTSSPTALKEAALIEAVAPSVAHLKQVVGKSAAGMKKFHPQSPLSNWTADMLRFEAQRVTGIDCDLAIANFGGIRVDMPKGDIILEDIRSMFPFKNNIAVVQIPGERLYAVLDSLARNSWQALSNVEIVANRTSGIESIKIGGKDFDKSKVYNLATIDFLLGSGDNMHLNRGAVSCNVTDVQVFDAAMHYIGELDRQGRTVDAAIDGRIRMSDQKPYKPKDKQNKSREVEPIPAGKNYTLTILHTNDTHSNIDPMRVGRYEGKGGIVGRAALVDSVRRADGKKNVLLLDAGDFEQGTPYFSILGGKVEIESMNIMGYDAVTFGNHEWDNGANDLKQRMAKAKFKTLLCNYETSDKELQKFFSPYAIFKRGGKKIAVIGILADITRLVAEKAENDIKYVNPVAPVNKWAEYLKTKKKCDLVIVLSHCGLSGENPNDPGDCEIIPELRNVDIIIGGHTHTDLLSPKWIADADGKEVMIVTDYCHGIYLGEIKL